MIERAKPHRLDGVFRGGECRQHDYRRGVVAFPDATKNFYAVHAARHSQIEQHAVDIVRRDDCQSLATGSGDARRVSKISDSLSEPFAQRVIVIHDQDVRHGTSISNSAPSLVGTSRASPP